jgi:chromosome segregation ATPase
MRNDLITAHLLAPRFVATCESEEHWQRAANDLAQQRDALERRCAELAREHDVEHRVSKRLHGELLDAKTDLVRLREQLEGASKAAGRERTENEHLRAELDDARALLATYEREMHWPRYERPRRGLLERLLGAVLLWP